LERCTRLLTLAEVVEASFHFIVANFQILFIVSLYRLRALRPILWLHRASRFRLRRIETKSFLVLVADLNRLVSCSFVVRATRHRT